MDSQYSSRFPGFQQVFAIGTEFSRRDFTVDIDLGELNPVDVTRGRHPIEEATAQWVSGSSRPSEVIWPRVVGPILLGERLCAALRAHSITGWGVYPVKVYGKDRVTQGNFFGLVVNGRCGPIDPSRAQRSVKEYPGGAFPVVRGLYFEEASWDGTDIFMASDETAWIFVTQRVVDIIAPLAKSVAFQRLVDVEQIPVD
jgi:hypothetical protein